MYFLRYTDQGVDLVKKNIHKFVIIIANFVTSNGMILKVNSTKVTSQKKKESKL